MRPARLRPYLDLTGIILTKADGDARGGAALSVREVTGKPIVFLGVGEKSEALELFDPERMAQRILGMGDVVALVETVQRNIEDEEAQRLARKVAKGQSFDLGDLRSQLDQVRRMGGLGALMDKLPAHMARRGPGTRSGRPAGATADGHHRLHDRPGTAHARASSMAPAAAGSPAGPGCRYRT